MVMPHRTTLMVSAIADPWAKVFRVAGTKGVRYIFRHPQSQTDRLHRLSILMDQLRPPAT